MSTTHVFDLLALAFDREIVAIARLVTPLPRPLFVELGQRMAATAGHGAQTGNSGAGNCRDRRGTAA